ncbi:hypothetical protein LWI28_021207 [Acer negundo]|uniref:Reverse transcriptase zinc-binding domain-containing protein n=1 Tax=Acer negundo TaxID=4023 RepID=A0AAD5NKI7_ACENE|nr:hypothetical protein LWI28_021207 [Acer negundo]
MKSCYYKDISILEDKKKANGYYMWNNLIWGKGLLDAGVRYRVGDGKSIKITKEKWIPRPNTFKIYSLPKLDGNAKVNQLISSFGGWDIHIIKGNFFKKETNQILKILIVGINRCDSQLWHYNEDGQYSVKSGYWLGHSLENIMGPSNTTPQTSWWNTFWNVKIPTKVKMFIWKVYQDWIPTKINIGWRGVQTNGVCEAYKNSADDTLHTF